MSHRPSASPDRRYEGVISRATPPVLDHDDRACKGTDPKLFFPDHGAHLKQAKEICNRCPHIDPCLEWAVDTEQGHGVWGGTSADERWELIKKRRADQALIPREDT